MKDVLCFRRKYYRNKMNKESYGGRYNAILVYIPFVLTIDRERVINILNL